jgi:hypothetical protein
MSKNVAKSAQIKVSWVKNGQVGSIPIRLRQPAIGFRASAVSEQLIPWKLAEPTSPV